MRARENKCQIPQNDLLHMKFSEKKDEIDTRSSPLSIEFADGVPQTYHKSTLRVSLSEQRARDEVSRKRPTLQRLPLTRALEGLFSLLKPEVSWTRQSTVSMVFSRALTEKVPSSLNEGQRLTRIILNDDGVFNYFIKMKDYIVKTTSSLRAQWDSRNTLS